MDDEGDSMKVLSKNSSDSKSLVLRTLGSARIIIFSHWIYGQQHCLKAFLPEKGLLASTC